MKEGYRLGTIHSNVEISPDVYEMIIDGEFTGNPGQFYMVRGWEALDPFLPRPLSIANIENNKVKFLYVNIGKGTNIIGKLKKGDTLSLLGPLGNQFNIKVEGKIAIISGGIGIAPMLYLSNRLSGDVDIYSGFKKNAYFLDQIRPYVKNIHIATEDGSMGHKGYITEVFDPSKYDVVYACGPNPMMEAVAKMCQGVVPVYVSMEARMACGVGACLGCAVETTRGMERVCKDGPIFKGQEVKFND